MEEGDNYYKLKSHFLLMSASDFEPGGACYKIKYISENLPFPIIAGVFTQSSHMVYNFYRNTSWGRYNRDCINNTQV